MDLHGDTQDAQEDTRSGSVYWDRLAKTFYSSIMVDLGQNVSNILTRPDLLREYNLYTNDFPYWARIGTYDEIMAQNSGGPLGVTQSTFFAQYLCQVPKMKSKPSLVVAVILADIVFLSTSWKIYTWLVGQLLARGGRKTMYCEGCMQIAQQGGYVEVSRDGVFSTTIKLSSLRRSQAGEDGSVAGETQSLYHEDVDSLWTPVPGTQTQLRGDKVLT